MIPLKIQLKNFLSYGPELQTINFEPYSLICLSGKNGHGKSALLDAITWALWGQARKTFGTAKADEGLIRLGQTLMMVVLDFSFNGQTYRIRREFAKTYGKPYAVLEFGILNQENDTLIPLTDKTIRQTQEKIERMLNLDAESFANSAFLRQGQANEFSKKSAKDRKTLLATILGLNRYDVVRTLALHKAKDALAQKQQLQLMQEKHDATLLKKPLLVEQLSQTTTALTAIDQQEKEFGEQKNRLGVQRQHYSQQQQALQLLEYQQEQHQAQEAQLSSSLRTTFTQWRTTHSKLLKLPDYNQLEKQRKDYLDIITTHQEALQKSLEFKEQLLATKEAATVLEKKINQAVTTTINAKRLHIDRLALEKNATQTALSDLEKLLAQNTLYKENYEKELSALQKQLAEFNQEQDRVSPIEKQFERRKEYYQQFVTQGTIIKQQLEEMQKKQLLVQDNENPSCPLCEQNLSLTRKKFLKNRFDESQHFLQHRLARLKKVTIHLKTLLLEQHEQLKAARVNSQQSITCKLNITQLEQRMQEAATTAAQHTIKLEQLKVILNQQSDLLIAEQQQLDILFGQEHKELLSNSTYKELQEKISVLEQNLKNIAYNATDHKKAQQDLMALDTILNEYKQLTNQMPVQEQRKQALQEIIQQLKQLRMTIADILYKKALYKDLPEQLKILSQQEKDVDLILTTTRSQKELLLQEKGKLEHEQAQLLVLEQETLQHVEKIKQLDLVIDDYQVIATATSKDGIQALLIDEAIPEIEHEANELLAKLTNNQAQIFIESLRDLKKGGTKETLDIKISDTIGVRPYEMFSGGEAFRIDFALRIAISKLLARRAGTSLQTLIIDEGFGSQDEEGLSHIMDALYKIQDDFAKIIIVSHLPFMKDQFPVHFVVEKGPNGSAVKVQEQG